MSRRKRRALRQGTVNPAAQIATPEDAPLDVLLEMLREPALGSEERIEIAKICLPFVHPRIVPLQPAETGGEPASGPEPEAKPQPQKPIDICEPEYMIALAKTLGSALDECRSGGREVSHFVLACAEIHAALPGRTECTDRAKAQRVHVERAEPVERCNLRLRTDQTNPFEKYRCARRPSAGQRVRGPGRPLPRGRTGSSRVPLSVRRRGSGDPALQLTEKPR